MAPGQLADLWADRDTGNPRGEGEEQMGGAEGQKGLVLLRGAGGRRVLFV